MAFKMALLGEILMKKALIAALVCINVALVLALMAGNGAGTAKAQVIQGPSYLMVTGGKNAGSDGLYLLDLANHKLLAMKFNTSNKQMEPYMLRDLKRDFRMQN